jgi:trimeric autotransporter adhesin
MRRFLTLVCLLCVAIPAGMSISGCTRNPAGNYCNGEGFGLTDTQVSSIFLSPQTTGISLAFGQTQQISAPTAKTCKGTAASVSTYAYGTSNNQLVDISPSGNMCAGTWNRNTGGGIPNYTICNFPSPLPATAAGSGTLPYGVTYITATADSVTSNPVAVYVHPLVTSVTLAGPTSPTLAGPSSCLSQGVTAPTPLDVQACYVGTGGTQQLLCAPASVTSTMTVAPACGLPSGVALSSIPDCTAAIGTLSYTVGTPSVATINADTNQITAELPGTTVITASVAGRASSAGYFSTCPPASINLSLANGDTSGTITQGVTQNLTTTVYDTNGVELTGLTLNYQSTDPVDITASTTGGVTTNFPGVGSVNAICEPPACNPSPINETGLYGTGLALSSNPVTITVPGTASDYVWFSSPGQSQYFVPVELLTGTVGSPVRLPYVPNSMVMDKTGLNLYFGSQRELMVYSASSDTITAQSTGVPGVVLAVSPTGTQALINDQARQLFYIYTTSGGTASTYGGMGNAAQWTPDGNTLYVTDNANLNSPKGCSPQLITGHSDTLYVYNVNTGWTTYPLPSSPLPASQIPTCTTPPNVAGTIGNSESSPESLGAYPPIQTPAITVPGVGAYLRGLTTTEHTWCPSGTVGGTLTYYPMPPTDKAGLESDILAATTDGKHILTADLDGIGDPLTVSDIGVTVPSGPSSADPKESDGQCPGFATGALTPLSTNPNPQGPLTVNANASASAVTQLIPSPQSNLAFITYTVPLGTTTASASLPFYKPAADDTLGTVNYVPLVSATGTGAVTNPLAGAFTPDDATFFVSTAGDNKVHYINVAAALASPATADTQQITPALPSCVPVASGGVDPGCTYQGADATVPTTVIVVKPRSTT